VHPGWYINISYNYKVKKMTEYTEFVASLSLNEQYKMPLTNEDIEAYNGLIGQFLNYSAAGLELLPITYSNIKANAIEFSSRLKATYELESPCLNRAREKLTLSIPLMKSKDAEIAKLLEQNLKDIIVFFKAHDVKFEFGLSNMEDHPTPAQEAIDDAKRRLRGVNTEEEQEAIDFGVKHIIDNQHRRPCDQRRPKEIDDIFCYVQDSFNGAGNKDPYTKNIDDFLVASLQKMTEDKAQMEMSKAKAIELSNFKRQTKLKEADAKNKRMNDAVDCLVEACKKRNKGEN
jgi:hypothetical protein